MLNTGCAHPASQPPQPRAVTATATAASAAQAAGSRQAASPASQPASQPAARHTAIHQNIVDLSLRRRQPENLHHRIIICGAARRILLGSWLHVVVQLYRYMIAPTTTYYLLVVHVVGVATWTTGLYCRSTSIRIPVPVHVEMY